MNFAVTAVTFAPEGLVPFTFPEFEFTSRLQENAG